MRVRMPSLALVFLAMLAVLLSACARGSTQAAATPTPVPTGVVAEKPTYQVQRGTVVEEIKFSGRLSSVREEELSFHVDGRVDDVNVQQGDQVRRGDVLATLEVSDLLNQLAQAQLNLEQAQLRQKAAQDSTGQQQTALDIALAVAQLRLAQAQVQDPAPAVAIAAATLDKARAAVELAQAAYDIRKQSPGVGASQEALNLRQATQDYLIAGAQFTQTVQTRQAHEYDVQILAQDVRLAELNLQQAETIIDPALDQEVQKSGLAIERLQAQLANARLTASIDGEVTMVAVKTGDNISAYRPAILVVTPGDIEVSAHLTGADMGRLSIGQPCLVSAVGAPDTSYHGSIRRMPYPYGTGGSSEAGGASEDQSTRITIDDRDAGLVRGDLVNVVVTLQKKDGALWLHPGAFRTFQGRTFVVALTAEGQRRIPVRVGIKGEERWEILSGADEGLVVVGP